MTGEKKANKIAYMSLVHGYYRYNCKSEEGKLFDLRLMSGGLGHLGSLKHD